MTSQDQRGLGVTLAVLMVLVVLAVLLGFNRVLAQEPVEVVNLGDVEAYIDDAGADLAVGFSGAISGAMAAIEPPLLAISNTVGSEAAAAEEWRDEMALGLYAVNRTVWGVAVLAVISLLVSVAGVIGGR